MEQYEKEKYPSHTHTHAHTQLSDEYILLIKVLYELAF